MHGLKDREGRSPNMPFKPRWRLWRFADLRGDGCIAFHLSGPSSTTALFIFQFSTSWRRHEMTSLSDQYRASPFTINIPEERTVSRSLWDTRDHLDLEVEAREPVHTYGSPVGIGLLWEHRVLD